MKEMFLALEVEWGEVYAGPQFSLQSIGPNPEKVQTLSRVCITFIVGSSRGTLCQRSIVINKGLHFL